MNDDMDQSAQDAGHDAATELDNFVRNTIDDFLAEADGDIEDEPIEADRR
ncbi:MAG: hypothetical protein ABSD90_17965 [Methylocystis sp.]|jgi:hypothetical protein